MEFFTENIKLSVLYKTLNSAGFDIRSRIETTLLPGERELIPTGLWLVKGSAKSGHAFGLDWVEALDIRPRSGLAVHHGITVLNSPGTIDADYERKEDGGNEIGVILYNAGSEPFEVKVGDRIAQGVIILAVTGENVPRLKVERDGGLGSTGVQ